MLCKRPGTLGTQKSWYNRWKIDISSHKAKASALEKERSTFQRRNKKQVKVFKVTSDSRSCFVSEESTITKLVSAVDKLTSKVSSRQPELNDLRESNQAITDSNSFASGSVINITNIILSIVITVFTVAMESTLYEIVPQPNISSTEIRWDC